MDEHVLLALPENLLDQFVALLKVLGYIVVLPVVRLVHHTPYVQSLKQVRVDHLFVDDAHHQADLVVFQDASVSRAEYVAQVYLVIVLIMLYATRNVLVIPILIRLILHHVYIILFLLI